MCYDMEALAAARLSPIKQMYRIVSSSFKGPQGQRRRETIVVQHGIGDLMDALQKCSRLQPLYPQSVISVEGY